MKLLKLIKKNVKNQKSELFYLLYAEGSIAKVQISLIMNVEHYS
jgi:hypothetical protein